ncbi:MAG: HU family DNA-binding protein, partial [Bacteroidales bacterium]
MNTKFLCELIENNTRVILPEFGAFLVKDDGSGVFKPKNITFSPFLRYNDGMIEDALASAKNVGKDEARKLLDNYIETLKDELSKGKNIPLEGLGFLYADSRGSIHFSLKESSPQSKTTEEEKSKPEPEPKPKPEPKPEP